MSDINKFPNGYNVTVCRKQDILDCIDKNILDKEVVLEIIDDLEHQIAEGISQDRWMGIPFIGSIRRSKNKKLLDTPEQKALIEEAKSELDKQQYILFRTRLNKDNAKRIKEDRYYRYITSLAIGKNRLVFNKLCKLKGEAFARLYLYASYNVVAQNNEYVSLVDYYE
uniref:DNA binding protein HU beta n=1 Tax=Geladintestivirus 2 TaxID=3233134 RepID=A0AAU8MIM0_9CAUD